LLKFLDCTPPDLDSLHGPSFQCFHYRLHQLSTLTYCGQPCWPPLQLGVHQSIYSSTCQPRKYKNDGVPSPTLQSYRRLPLRPPCGRSLPGFFPAPCRSSGHSNVLKRAILTFIPYRRRRPWLGALNKAFQPYSLSGEPDRLILAHFRLAGCMSRYTHTEEEKNTLGCHFRALCSCGY